jgi:hypothetical protein
MPSSNEQIHSALTLVWTVAFSAIIFVLPLLVAPYHLYKRKQTVGLSHGR